MVTAKRPDGMVPFLDGNVSKLTLPVFSGRPAPDAPALKRLALPQGELAQFWSGDQGMRYIAMMELREGGVRGNHYHQTKEEFVYIISGIADLVVEDRSTRKRETISLQAGDLAIIRPAIAHALKVQAAGCGIEFSPQAFDAADSFQYRLI